MNLPEEGVVLSFTEFSLLSLYQVVLFGVQRRVSVVQQTVRTEALSSLSPFLLTHTNSLLLVLAIVANCFLPFQIIICLSLRTCKHRTRRNGNKSSSWVHRREGGGGGQGTVVVSLHAVNCGRHSLLWLVCWPLLFDRVHHGWRIRRIKNERVETVHEATTTGNVFEFWEEQEWRSELRRWPESCTFFCWKWSGLFPCMLPSGRHRHLPLLFSWSKLVATVATTATTDSFCVWTKEGDRKRERERKAVEKLKKVECAKCVRRKSIEMEYNLHS